MPRLRTRGLFVAALVAATAVASAPAHAGLVTHLRFDDGSGLVADDTGSLGNDGDLLGYDPPNDDSQWVGGALEFDGADQNVSLTDRDEYDGGDGVHALTLAGWIKPDNLTTGNVIAAKWTYPSQGSWALQNSNDKLLAFVATSLTDTGSHFGITSAGALTTGAWQHVAMVYDGSGATVFDRLKIYVNGAEQTVGYGGNIPTTLQDSTAPVLVGRFGGSVDRHFDGTMDDLRIYNEALSGAEILTLSNASPDAVPEPTTCALAALALGVQGLRRRPHA